MGRKKKSEIKAEISSNTIENQDEFKDDLKDDENRKINDNENDTYIRDFEGRELIDFKKLNELIKHPVSKNRLNECYDVINKCVDEGVKLDLENKHIFYAHVISELNKISTHRYKIDDILYEIVNYPFYTYVVPHEYKSRINIPSKCPICNDSVKIMGHHLNIAKCRNCKFEIIRLNYDRYDM